MEAQTDNAAKARRKLDKSTLIWVVLGVIIIAIAGINLWSAFDTKPEVLTEAVAVSVPDFNLTNQQGEPLGLSDMAGKIWIADFIFTNCPTICPAMTQDMARLQSEFVADPVYFVSFSVDPERDTADILSRYAKAYGADDKRWHFLTGDKAHIYQLAEQGFSLAAGHKGSEILHSPRFVLVKADGNIYDYYDSRSKPAMGPLTAGCQNAPRKMRDLNLLISLAAFMIHFTFGFFRGRFKRFSRPWSRCLYIPIVINIVVRRFILHWGWQTAMVYLWPATLIAHILGGVIGARYKSDRHGETD